MNWKLTVFAGLSFLIGSSQQGNCGNFGWVKQIGGPNAEYGASLVVDGNGNVYSTGSFNSTCDFNPDTGTNSLTSFGSGDAFIFKQDAAGNFIWARQLGGTSTDFGHAIALDDSGNIYSTGHFQGTGDFDPGPGIYNLTSLGGNEIYVSKLDSSGNFIWAKQLGGTNNDECVSLALDDSGNVHLVGYFIGTSDFDPGPGTFNLVSIGANLDVFVCKLNASGNFVWAKKLGGGSGDQGDAIAVDDSGNVYTTGSFVSTADFDPDAGVYNLISSGVDDVFISKLNSSGNFVWAKKMGGLSNNYGYAIALDSNRNVYTAGSFRGTCDFDPDTGSYNLVAAGSSDIFVSKLDASGNFIWAKKMGGTNTDEGLDLKVSANGNVYSTGRFVGTGDFDPDTSTFNLTTGTSTYVEIFVSKLDSSGNFVWAKQLGGTSPDLVYALNLDPAENVYATGYFNGLADFDPGVDSFNLATVGLNDMFIVKLCNSSSATISISSCYSFTSPSGNYTWYTSGLYTDTIPNTSGCDSIITINLVIETVDTSVTVSPDTTSLAANASGATFQWLDCNNGFSPIAGETSQTFNSIGNGSYAVEVTQNGCVDTSACYAKNSCFASYSLYPDTIPHNWIAVNQSIGAGTLSYIWSWGDGDTSYGMSPIHTYLDTGYYTICLSITDSLNCSHTYCNSSTLLRGSSTSTMVTVNVITPLGIKDPVSDKSLFIFPNPTTAQVTISSPTGIDELRIFNLIGGQIMIEHKAQGRSGGSKEIQMDVSGFTPGIYFIQATIGKNVITKKLVVTN